MAARFIIFKRMTLISCELSPDLWGLVHDDDTRYAPLDTSILRELLQTEFDWSTKEMEAPTPTEIWYRAFPSLKEHLFNVCRRNRPIKFAYCGQTDGVHLRVGVYKLTVQRAVYKTMVGGKQNAGMRYTGGLARFNSRSWYSLIDDEEVRCKLLTEGPSKFRDENGSKISFEINE